MPEIFVQISDPANPENYKVITGLCILVRSPAFHPFDSLLIYLTVEEGTYESSKLLNVMTSCIWYIPRQHDFICSTMLSFFLPTAIGILQGSLCVATRLSGSQCSGGDLDGDDYTVIWAEVQPPPAYLIRQDMIPENLNETAMNYTARAYSPRPKTF